jgi:hypothetical protein
MMPSIAAALPALRLLHAMRYRTNFTMCTDHETMPACMPTARSRIGMVRSAGRARWAALIVAAAVVEGGLRGAVGPGLRVPARMVIVFSVSSPPSAAPHLRALRLRGGSAGDAGAPGRARPGRHGRREKKRK